MPRHPSLRLEENRVVRGRGESLVDHEEIRAGLLEQSTNLLSVIGSARRWRTGSVWRVPLGSKSRWVRPVLQLRRGLVSSRYRPTFEKRRIDVFRIGCRSGNSDIAHAAVGSPRLRCRGSATSHQVGGTAQNLASLSKSGEVAPDQQRQGLTKISRRLPNGT